MPLYRFVADIHIGNHKQFGGEITVGMNARCRRVVQALALAATQERRSLNLVVLGDLFDISNPSPQVIAATMKALAAGESGVHLLLGNHDMVSTQPGDHALAPFGFTTLWRWRYYEQPTVVPASSELSLFMIPFRPEPLMDWFAEEVGNLAANTSEDGRDPQRILCFHAGVRDHNTPKYLWASPDAIDVDVLFDTMKRAGIQLALCGNWHTHRVWKRDKMTVVQVGALVPTGFDNEGWDYGYCVEYDTDSRRWSVSQYPTARFLALTMREVRAAAQRIINHAGGVYLKVRLTKDETPERVTQELSELGLTTSGEDALLGLSFVAHEESTAQQEMEAAEAARIADTLEGALREYVQAMPLTDGVQRDAVEAKVLNYVARE